MENKSSSSGSSTPLEQLRAACPLVNRQIYLANCSQGPQSLPVRSAIEAFLDQWERLGMHWNGWIAEVEQARAAFAALIGAEIEDIAVGTSVSQLTASVASALMQPGAQRRRILSSVVEFPGVAQAWHAATRAGDGWTLEVITGEEREAVPVARLAAERALLPEPFTSPAVVIGAEQVIPALNEETALVSLPLVSYTNGALLDVQQVVEAAHAQDTLVFLDAYQAVGSVPINVQESKVDFLVAGALKYLLSVAGIAFLYVRPALRERFTPSITGWFGRGNPFDFNPVGLEYASAASRFDLGTPPLVNAFAARAGMELILQTGVEGIKSHLDQLTERALHLAADYQLTIFGPDTPARKGAILAVDAGSVDDAHTLEGKLRQRGVIVSARGNALRLAPHGFTQEQELEQALAVVAELLGAGAA